MRAVVQRVSSASVTVEGETVGAVGPGMMVLIGGAAEGGRGGREQSAEPRMRLRY